MPALSVTQLNEYIKGILSDDPLLSRVDLRGEISGFKRHTSGHMYFMLKDEESAIRCVMFRQNTLDISFSPRDGLSVVLTGEVSVYIRDGQYQFYVRRMALDGVGALYKAYLELKAKLENEGLFDASRKRRLPKYPNTVGVVTSETGAVFHDIVKVATRRDPRVNIILMPARVQGAGAACEIADGVRTLSVSGLCDVIIVGRGGGSPEDLFCFNDETVARAIAASEVPIISAVGHETDFTIADFVADVRAPTPSAAAELCVPQLSDMRLDADALTSGLDDAMIRLIARKNDVAERLIARLHQAYPGAQIARAIEGVNAKQTLLATLIRNALDRENARVESLAQRLEALSPKRVLGRGYAVVRAGGRVVTKVADAPLGALLSVVLSDGNIAARVE